MARTLLPAVSQAELTDGRYWLDPDTSRLHVRFRNDGQWRWMRIKACTQQYRGEAWGPAPADPHQPG